MLNPHSLHCSSPSPSSPPPREIYTLLSFSSLTGAFPYRERQATIRAHGCYHQSRAKIDAGECARRVHALPLPAHLLRASSNKPRPLLYDRSNSSMLSTSRALVKWRALSSSRAQQAPLPLATTTIGKTTNRPALDLLLGAKTTRLQIPRRPPRWPYDAGQARPSRPQAHVRRPRGCVPQQC